MRAIERIWDFYFELFGQRQSMFADWLLSCDRIALSCYQAAYLGVGEPKPLPAPPPFCYARTGFSPATFRRGIPLRRLGRQLNPFPLVQLPYHRLVNPWTLGAVLHEVSHNLQSDLGLNKAVPVAIGRRLLEEDCPPAVVAGVGALEPRDLRRPERRCCSAVPPSSVRCSTWSAGRRRRASAIRRAACIRRLIRARSCRASCCGGWGSGSAPPKTTKTMLLPSGEICGSETETIFARSFNSTWRVCASAGRPANKVRSNRTEAASRKIKSRRADGFVIIAELLLEKMPSEFRRLKRLWQAYAATPQECSSIRMRQGGHSPPQRWPGSTPQQ